MAVCDVVLENIEPDNCDVGAAGGVQALYVVQISKVVSFTPGVTAGELSYTAVTLDTTADVFVKILPRSKTATATFTTELGDEGGNSVAMEIIGFLNNQEELKAYGLQQLSDGGFLAVIAHYNTGKAIVFGYDENLKLNTQLKAAVDGESGAVFNDRQGYTVRFLGDQVDIPRPFIGTIDVSGGTQVTFV